MDRIEWIAAAMGVANVVLLVRRSVWNYPFGIATVALYFFVFREARLYSDMALQVFFLVIQLYGWWSWSRAPGADGGVRVGVLSGRERLAWGAAVAACSLILGSVMASRTDAASPMTDAFVAAASVAAQLLLALRRVENWALWVLVDLVAIGLYASRGLFATSVLYAVFLALAVTGWAAWARAWRTGAAA